MLILFKLIPYICILVGRLVIFGNFHPKLQNSELFIYHSKSVSITSNIDIKVTRILQFLIIDTFSILESRKILT